MFSQIKDRKHIEQNYHSVARIMRQGWDFGVLGCQNFSVGICDGAPSTARSRISFGSPWFSLPKCSFKSQQYITIHILQISIHLHVYSQLLLVTLDFGLFYPLFFETHEK